MEKQKESRRVFIGIKVSGSIAEFCVNLQSNFADLPAKFVPPEDIHVTLLPPWQMSEQAEVEERLRQAIARTKQFVLRFDRLAYGPNDRRPRLAWIECASSPGLITLKQDLLKTFEVGDRVPFLPHATIARFADKDADLLRHRPIERPVALSMHATSVQLFESPHQGGTGYKILASLTLPSE